MQQLKSHPCAANYKRRAFGYIGEHSGNGLTSCQLQHLNARWALKRLSWLDVQETACWCRRGTMSPTSLWLPGAKGCVFGRPQGQDQGGRESYQHCQPQGWHFACPAGMQDRIPNGMTLTSPRLTLQFPLQACWRLCRRLVFSGLQEWHQPCIRGTKCFSAAARTGRLKSFGS